jgi:hypothetical protein
VYGVYPLILPKGRAVVENMPASCVHMSNLLESSEATDFSGYIELRMENATGIVFYCEGEVINSLFVDEKTFLRKTGQEAFSLLLNQGDLKDGIISQHGFSTNIAKALATTASNKIVFSNLSTDFISLKKIIGNLESKGFTGYIELQLTDKKQIALIFFEGGKPIECSYSSLKTGKSRSGLDILSRVVKYASQVGAVINVYETIKQPTGKIKMATPSPDRKDIVEFLKVSFHIMDSVFTSQFDNNEFENVFTDMCIGVTDDYPFMHPFADEIVYRDGHLNIDSEVSIEQALEGINRCLYCVFESTGHMPPEIRTGIMDAMGEESLALMKRQVGKKIPILFG